MDQSEFLFDFEAAPARRIFTVSELNSAIRDVLQGEFNDVRVAGEISGLKLAASGHYYFTLKDGESQIKAVAFRSSHRYWKFKPQDGMAVLARGRLDVYEARGEYQLLVELLEPQGLGALQVAFDQLKKKLAAEGLFAAERKRPLPRFPRRIGIVTSPRGAAIADMIQILSRRFPGLHIRLYPALVQGEGSVEEICRGIEYFSRTKWPDIVIVGRGGGSLEDLWSFNEEAVARAIAASKVPVVSAVGHETDVTIADFVADLRAPTPSAAAELIVPTREDCLERIATADRRAVQLLRYRLAMLGRRLHQQGIDRAHGLLARRVGRAQQRIDEQSYRLKELARAAIDGRARQLRFLESRLARFDMRPRLATDRRRLEASHTAALQLIGARLVRSNGAMERLSAQLVQLSPLKILERGYAIVTNERGIVKDAAEAPAGSEIHVRLGRGELDAGVRRSG
ncbi:MAG TPA: exodeoxyribonuclease VII large subunit [Candidatus Acidoferrales bacterium]|nr:exodeoxyribonuclease VII large subunit [Candidatus Acidoferrales bacterium]